jgi:hypothetical protein
MLVANASRSALAAVSAKAYVLTASISRPSAIPIIWEGRRLAHTLVANAHIILVEAFEELDGVSAFIRGLAT